MYCEVADILNDLSKDELISLLNDENRQKSAIDLTDEQDLVVFRCNEQISISGNEIDGYLRSRYSMPLSPVPARIKQICKDIAIYNCYKRRMRLDMPESIVRIYGERIKELINIQKGLINLEVTPPDDNAEIIINKTESDRIFSKYNF